MDPITEQLYYNNHYRIIDIFGCKYCNLVYTSKSLIIKHSVAKHKPLTVRYNLDTQYIKYKLFTNNCIFEKQ